MATDQSYIDFLREKLKYPEIMFKAMFGEYAMYFNGVVVGLVCDTKLYVKNLKTTEHFANTYELQAPYPGAKNQYYIPDDCLDDERDFYNILQALSQEVEQKKKKPKQKIEKQS